MNRKSYARTSSQPGKTQTINFYNINQALYYVDLLDTATQRFLWRPRPSGKDDRAVSAEIPMLKLVFLLVDIRHEPSANDK